MKVLHKVLIVDDSPTMRQIIIRELLAMDFSKINLFEAGDGKQAIQMVLEKEFDLIIMDWNMPNILGIDAIRSIRGAGVKTPILMVTTEGEKTNVVQAIQAGANNYLVKPFTGAALQEKVRTFFPDLPKSNAEPQPVASPKYQVNTGINLEESKIYQQRSE